MGQLSNNVGFRAPCIGDNDDGPRTAEKQLEGFEKMPPRFLIPTTKL